LAPDAGLVARQGFALGLGAISGYVFYRAGMPLPWMLGPMIANTIAAVLRAPVAPPMRLRPLVIPVIGVMLGASVTRDTFAHLGDWVWTVCILAPFLVTAAFASFMVYRRAGGYDRVTAYYAAMPGGLNEMLLIGTAAGGKEKRIALAHATRILVTIAFVGLFFGLVLGVRSGGPAGRPWIALDALGLMDYLVLGGCAVLGVPMGKILRLPAYNVLGPMVLSAVVHVTGIVHAAPPTLIVNFAQITLGTVIGCRFLGSTAREIGADLILGLLATVAMLGVAVAFAEVTSRVTGIPLPEVFLAYSPGGLTEMSLLALAMGQDVAYVSVMHILRILMVIAAAPVVFRFTRGD
jgi:membrane AbrB-like protein